MSDGLEKAAVDTLERLQAEALRELMSEAHACEGDGAYIPCLKRAVAMAREHGFKPIGGGSSRIAVELPRRKVAKVAYTIPGLLHNLQEAIFWLIFPPPLNRWLTPCVRLLPSLVLVQERVEVVGTPLIDYFEATPRRRSELDRLEDRRLSHFEEQILAFRQALYPGPPPEQVKIRPDNYGVRSGGLVVAIDYGEKWRPIGGAWAAVLRRLDAGSLELDSEARDWLAGELSGPPTGHRIGGETTGPDLLGFAERAGAGPADDDPCPCGEGGTFGDCYLADPECSLRVDGLDYMALMAINDLPVLA
jgi:hypothetical protein